MKRRYINLIAVCWIALLAGSLLLNLRQLHTAQQQINLGIARSLFGLVVTMQDWSSLHGGVYVPVSELAEPNPYLLIDDRDIHLPDGRFLTKINPAYMTRLMAELIHDENQARFHITSLRPANPGNVPADWEREALMAFEQQVSEFYTWDRQSEDFFYMAPLITEESCLSCHERHGYKLGDIRGGISIAFQVPPVNLWPVTLSHSVIMLVGLVAISMAGRQLSRAFNELEWQSQVDGLTGLYNRRYFDAYLQHEFNHWRRSHTPLALILIDVDCFKAYNDLYGHQAGDSCLRAIADALRGTVRRTGDVVARYGGEEFVLILPNTSARAAQGVAERARSTVEALAISHAGSSVSQYVTLSLGLAACHDNDTLPAALIERADRALYQAKQNGRNQVVNVSDELAQSPG
jgi:diguanylate cyclase (GGDEF)-like protein